MITWCNKVHSSDNHQLLSEYNHTGDTDFVSDLPSAHVQRALPVYISAILF